MAKRHETESAMLTAAIDRALEVVPNFDPSIPVGEATFPPVSILQHQDVLAFGVLIQTRDACGLIEEQKLGLSTCTWCRQATPEDQRENLVGHTEEEAKAHVFVCPHSPSVRTTRELASCLESVLASNATSYQTGLDRSEQRTYHVDHHVAETIKIALDRYRAQAGDRMSVLVVDALDNEEATTEAQRAAVREYFVPIARIPPNMTEEDLAAKVKAIESENAHRALVFDVEGPGVADLRAALEAFDATRSVGFVDTLTAPPISMRLLAIINAARIVVGK